MAINITCIPVLENTKAKASKPRELAYNLNIEICDVNASFLMTLTPCQRLCVKSSCYGAVTLNLDIYCSITYRPKSINKNKEQKNSDDC